MARQLAQFNIGRLKGANGDPHMAGFFDNLDRINALAERMPGFVWRLQAVGGADSALMMAGDEGLAFTLSVWESIEALEAFVWQTAHAKIYNRKAEFFENHATPNLVMWWIEAGHIPTVEEARERLARLTADGASEFAFGWESAPAAKLWRDKRCA